MTREPTSNVLYFPARSGDVSYGTGWISPGQPDGPAWEVQWRPDSGQVWAIDTTDPANGIILSTLVDQADVDAALTGWEATDTRELSWVAHRVDAATHTLDARHDRFQAWEDRLQTWEHDLSAGDPTRAWDLPADTPAGVLAEFRAEFGDEPIDTFARGFGLDPDLVDGLLTGRIERLDIAGIASVCDALSCSPYDLWEPAEARTILHAYGPERWPTHILPLDERPAPPLAEHRFLSRRLEAQAAELVTIDTPTSPTPPDATQPVAGQVVMTVYERAGTVAVTSTGGILTIPDGADIPKIPVDEYHIGFRQTGPPAPSPVHSRLLDTNPPAGTDVDPILAGLAETARTRAPGGEVELVRFTGVDGGTDAWVGWDPETGWDTWDDPRDYFDGPAELVIDPAGNPPPPEPPGPSLDRPSLTERLLPYQPAPSLG